MGKAIYSQFFRLREKPTHTILDEHFLNYFIVWSKCTPWACCRVYLFDHIFN